MNYTILLQGRIEKKAIDFWKTHFSNENICISIWEDDPEVNYKFPKKWNVIINKKPIERIGYKNFDLQLLSTINGLNSIKTKFSIKLRCDEYWSNLQHITESFNQNEDIIVCGSLYFRPVGMHPFHISDHIIAGKTENLKLMFNSAFENLKNNFWDFPIPESQLGLAYLLQKEPDLINQIGNIKLYDSIKPNLLEPFIDGVAKTKVEKYTNEIALFQNRIKNELMFESINWKNVKKWISLIEYILKDINFLLQKSEYPKIDEVSLLKKYFKIIDVEKLKPFLATCTINHLGERAWYESEISDFDKQVCITSL